MVTLALEDTLSSSMWMILLSGGDIFDFFMTFCRLVSGFCLPSDDSDEVNCADGLSPVKKILVRK